MGDCAGLNEALDTIGRVGCDHFDDVWHSDRLARHLAHLTNLSDRVAVVYSDAIRIDQFGCVLPGEFIETHKPGAAPPSGNIFHILAEGNFMAMAATVRRSAIAAVGGYDERLSYEDFDMWLKLAQRFEFDFVPATLARYRVLELVDGAYSVRPSNVRSRLYPVPDRGAGARESSSACMPEGKVGQSAIPGRLYPFHPRRSARCGLLVEGFCQGTAPADSHAGHIRRGWYAAVAAKHLFKLLDRAPPVA